MKRLLISFTLIAMLYLLILGCSEDEPTAPIPAVPAKVLILEDGGTQDSLFNILVSAGSEVTLGDTFFNYSGTDFSAYDLVILLNGIEYDHEIADSVQQGLKNFVTGGGVLLATEWLCYTINIGDYQQILDSILPVEASGGYDDGGVVETFLEVTNNAITAGVPDSFDTRAGWTYSEVYPNPRTQTTNYTVIYNGKVAGTPAMTMGTLGAGRVIHWSMAGQYFGTNIWSPEVRRIFINIANFSKSI